MTKSFSYKVKVYYEDTDAGGVVYYANYLKFLERARSEAIYSLGFSNTNLKKKKVITCILGGPNKYYDFFFKDMESIFNQLIGLNNISRVNVIASRRTPSDVFEKLRSSGYL